MITGNFDIVDMYKCLRSKLALFGYAKVVTVVISSQWRRMRKPVYMDSSIQTQLEEDGGGRIRQCWIETSGMSQ